MHFVQYRNKPVFQVIPLRLRAPRPLSWVYQASAEVQKRADAGRFKEIAQARCRVEVSSNSTGAADHAHELIGLSPDLDLCVFVNNLKTTSLHL
jgi:hypothetical protein